MKPAYGAGCTALERRVSIISGFTEFQQLFGHLTGPGQLAPDGVVNALARHHRGSLGWLIQLITELARAGECLANRGDVAPGRDKRHAERHLWTEAIPLSASFHS